MKLANTDMGWEWWKIESPTLPQQGEQKVHGSLWGQGPHRGEPQRCPAHFCSTLGR